MGEEGVTEIVEGVGVAATVIATGLAGAAYAGTAIAHAIPNCATVDGQRQCAQEREPVIIEGSGESLATANLSRGGYAVAYASSTWALIVEPVSTDGSTGSSVVNALGASSDSGVAGAAVGSVVTD